MNSAGESTTCSCTSYVCEDLSAPYGGCQFSCGIGEPCQANAGVGTVEDAGIVYCFNGDASSPQCSWSYEACANGYTTVPSCTATPPEYAPPPNTAANCSGLTWVPAPTVDSGASSDSGSGGCTLTHCTYDSFATTWSDVFEFRDSCCTSGRIAAIYSSNGSLGGETLTCPNAGGTVTVTCTVASGGCQDNAGASCTF